MKLLCGQQESNPAGVTVTVSAEHASVSLSRGTPVGHGWRLLKERESQWPEKALVQRETDAGSREGQVH